MTNPGFESGTSGWTNRSGGTLQAFSPGQSGINAARLFNRTSTSHGIQQSLAGSNFQNHALCRGSVWVKTSSSTAVTVSLSVQQNDTSGPKYSTIDTASVANIWTLLEGNFALRIDGALSSLQIYVSGPPSGVELLADSLSFGKIVIPAPENLLNNPGFESGLTGWAAHGGATLATSPASHTGTTCAVATRTAAFHGVEQNMLGKMQVGRTYFISAWVRTDSPVTETVKLNFARVEGATSYFTNIATEQASANSWVWLSGYYTPQPIATMTALPFFVEGPPAGVKLFFDDAYIAPVTGLRKAAANYPAVRLSAIMSTNVWPDNAKFANACAGHYHMAGTENDTKFAGTEGQQNVFSFARANATLDFGQAHGGVGRGHTMVWHGSSVPIWVTGVTRSPAEMQAILWNHIDTVTSYYRDRLPWWDVVNEAVLSNGELRTTATSAADPPYWYDSPGIGYAADGAKYIAESFKRARLSDPDAKLFYNDYSSETVNSKSTGIYNLLSSLRTGGAPVDGVGFQYHLGNTTFNTQSNYTNLLRFQNLGLELHITEMDVGLPVDANGVATAANLAAQGKIYFDALGTAIGLSSFKVFQTWGVYDGASWIPSFSNGAEGQALPFDFNLDKKPAFWGMWNALAGQMEKLPVLALSSGDTSTMVNDPLMSTASGRRLDATAANDFITFKQEVPFKGDWNVKIGTLKTTNGGTFQLAAAPPGSSTFSNVGTLQDTYASAKGSFVFDLGTTTFNVAGDWQFRFTAVSKHASSTGFALTLDYARLSPVACEPKFTQPLSDQVLAVNATLSPTLFIAEDDTASGSLMVTATSSNPTLIPLANLVIEGASPYYTLAATPAANTLGSATITMTANDGTLSAVNPFVVTVTGTAAETWRFSNFGTTANTGTAADTANPDGDAWTNADEFIFGTNPLTANSPSLLTPSRDSINFILTFTATGSVYPGLTRYYDVETTTNLGSTGSWTGLAGYTNIVAANQTVIVTQPSVDGARFYRLKVRMQ